LLGKKGYVVVVVVALPDLLFAFIILTASLFHL